VEDLSQAIAEAIAVEFPIQGPVDTRDRQDLQHQAFAAMKRSDYVVIEPTIFDKLNCCIGNSMLDYSTIFIKGSGGVGKSALSHTGQLLLRTVMRKWEAASSPILLAVLLRA